VGLVLLWCGLRAVGDYDWRAPGARWVGEAFWGFFSALNVAVPTLVWIHAVEHFRRDQGLRLFGLVGVGGTAGAALGSGLASFMCKSLELAPGTTALASLVLLEAAWLCYRRSFRACRELSSGATEAGGGAGLRVAGGGLLAGLRLLLREPYLLAIGGYMLMLGMVATAFAVAQIVIVGDQVADPRGQHGLLADVETLTQCLVLVLQLFWTGRLLRSLPQALFLCLLPLLAVLGLGALWLWPLVATVAIVQILRRGAQFALEKPAREVLYTPLDLETKHKVKFLLDTFAFRFGDLLGAWLQVLAGAAGPQAGVAVPATMVLCACWAALGLLLGRRRRWPAGA
jgi:AAA family ATP:ADP antiporter